MSSQAITPELREWIVAQARAGCRPEDVLQSMRTSGWDEDTAIDALETTLQDYLATQPAAQVLPAPVPVPGPDLSAAPSLLQALDRQVEVLMAMRSPRLIVFGGLMSDDECEQMIELAEPRLARSETVHNPSGGSEVHASRTSDGMFFERGEHGIVDRLDGAGGVISTFNAGHPVYADVVPLGNGSIAVFDSTGVAHRVTRGGAEDASFTLPAAPLPEIVRGALGWLFLAAGDTLWALDFELDQD